ncbi:MAG: DNA polymerase III subunit delta' [Pseudomonadota bacterium]|nr:DNA polymerase III subunit delta' [Pseudomonadota bacterium]
MSGRAVYGHERQREQLGAAIAGGRLAHAYLFHGRDGIGKQEVAKAFAAAVLCGKGQPTPCDACVACKKVQSGNHPDLIILKPDGAFIRMQAVRELIGAMAFRPMEGGRRLFLIDDADRLHPAAANALLKTLEEPAAANIIVLITAKPYLLPRTIISRCRQLRFQPLRRETVARFLEEQGGLEANAAHALAASAEGSIARALQLRREDYLADREGILARLAAGQVGAPLSRLALFRHLGKRKKDIPDKLTLLQSCFRDALVWRELQDREMLIHGDCLEQIRGIARLSTNDLLFNLDAIDASLRALEANANKLLTLEAMTFTLRL